MAPEVLSSQVLPASDVWSAGVMAYQLLTGQFPFDDKSNPFKPSVAKIWLVQQTALLQPSHAAKTIAATILLTGTNCIC